MSITTEVILVTPEIAQNWLDNNNAKNRTIRHDTVRQYVRTMQAGKWRVGDPISFDYNSQLVNGQHRLMAVVEFGRPVEFLVIRGLEPEAMDTYDQGLRRAVSDVLAHRGLPNGNATGVATAWWIMIQLGESPVNSRARRLITATDIADFMENNLEAARFAHHMCQVAANWAIAAPIGCAAYILTDAGVPQATYENFIDVVRYGANLNRDDVRLLLHQRILSRPTGRDRNPRQGPEMLATILDAWNLHVAGKPRRSLPWTPCPVDWVPPTILVPGTTLSAVS